MSGFTTRRVCECCDAVHVFTYVPYSGRRIHSSPKESVTLLCRRCIEPLMEWQDKDGDTFRLSLDATVEQPPVPVPLRRKPQPPPPPPPPDEESPSVPSKPPPPPPPPAPPRIARASRHRRIR